MKITTDLSLDFSSRPDRVTYKGFSGQYLGSGIYFFLGSFPSKSPTDDDFSLDIEFQILFSN